MLLAVRTSSYGCTWEVWRALKKLELLSAAPRATLTLLSCSPNFPRASITRCTHAKHEPIANYFINDSFICISIFIYLFGYYLYFLFCSFVITATIVNLFRRVSGKSIYIQVSDYSSAVYILGE